MGIFDGWSSGNCATSRKLRIDNLALVTRTDAAEQMTREAKSALSDAIRDCGKDKQQLVTENSGLQSRLRDAEAQLHDSVVLKPEPMETYYNNKHSKASITYESERITPEGEVGIIGYPVSVDVRNFFGPADDFVMKLTLQAIPGYHVSSSIDEKALTLLLWVQSHVTYTSDNGEFWQKSAETLVRKKGDCEDGAILLANLMIVAGIPYWRIRLNAGDVKGGGHAYVSYCRTTDERFVVLDWCYWPNSLPISNRKLHEQELDYWKCWFSWNPKYSFAEPTYDTAVGDMNLLKKFSITRW